MSISRLMGSRKDLVNKSVEGMISKFYIVSLTREVWPVQKTEAMLPLFMQSV